MYDITNLVYFLSSGGLLSEPRNVLKPQRKVLKPLSPFSACEYHTVNDKYSKVFCICNSSVSKCHQKIFTLLN